MIRTAQRTPCALRGRRGAPERSWPVCVKLAGAMQVIFDTHRTTSVDARTSVLSASVALRPCRRARRAGGREGVTGFCATGGVSALHSNLHRNYTQLSTTRKVLAERPTKPVPGGAGVLVCHKSRADVWRALSAPSVLSPEEGLKGGIDSGTRTGPDEEEMSLAHPALRRVGVQEAGALARSESGLSGLQDEGVGLGAEARGFLGGATVASGSQERLPEPISGLPESVRGGLPFAAGDGFAVQVGEGGPCETNGKAGCLQPAGARPARRHHALGRSGEDVAPLDEDAPAIDRRGQRALQRHQVQRLADRQALGIPRHDKEELPGVVEHGAGDKVVGANRAGHPGHDTIQHEAVALRTSCQGWLAVLARGGELGQADRGEALSVGQRWQQFLAELLVVAVAQAPASGIALAQEKTGRQAGGGQADIALEQGGTVQFQSTEAMGNAPAGGADSTEDLPGGLRPAALGIGRIGPGGKSIQGVLRYEFIRRHGALSCSRSAGG